MDLILVMKRDYRLLASLVREEDSIADALERVDRIRLSGKELAADRYLVILDGLSRDRNGSLLDKSSVLSNIENRLSSLEEGEVPEDGILALFLDTTIQWDKFMKTDERASQVRRNLREKRVFTSSLVYKEFNMGLMNRFRRLYNIANKCESSDELKVQIADDPDWAFVKTWPLMQNLFEKEEDPIITTDLRELRMVIKHYLEGALDFRFRQSIDAVIDNINCPHGVSQQRGKSEMQSCSQVTCSRQDATCDIDTFIKSNKSDFRKILHRLQAADDEKLDKQMRTMRDTLDVILSKDLKHAKGQRNCKAIGDSVIAVEMPTEMQMYTTNIKHFGLLCKQILGKALYKEHP